MDETVAKLLRDMHTAGKPIGALCIAPAVLAKVFGKTHNPEVTIGRDKVTAAMLQKLGVKHVETNATEISVDEENRMVTSPCYMVATNLRDVETGIEKLVHAVLEMATEERGTFAGETRKPAMAHT